MRADRGADRGAAGAAAEAGGLCCGRRARRLRRRNDQSGAAAVGRAPVIRNNLRRPRESGDPGAADRRMNEKRPCVYILASKHNGTLYVGVTSDIARRAWEHRSNAVSGFVRDYGVNRLVFVEFHETMGDAILREKRIKKWRRVWKLELIERHNPQWRDLCDELT